MAKPWDAMLTETDRNTIARGRWAQRVGPGARPVVLVVDIQNCMVGERGRESADYPISCGESGWRAIDASMDIIAGARAAGVPVIYLRFGLDRNGKDGGIFARKIGSGSGEYSFLRNTHGGEIVADVAPREGELVFDKIKHSAFFGTPLESILREQGIDTLVVVGGSTSNCIRATVVDGAQYNYRVLVPYDAVFDRIELSHAAALFDMDRTFADVVSTSEILDYFNELTPGSQLKTQ
jgi:nicotinamidase-related amidase